MAELKKVLIRVEDIAQVRKLIKVGDILETEIVLEDDDMRGRLRVPKKKVKMAVIKKFKWLVEVAGDGPKLPRKTVTYVEILQRQMATQNRK